jgi:hypothetical protein
VLDSRQQLSRKRQSAKQPGDEAPAFPAPWTVEAIDAGFKIIDANKQAIAYVDGHADKRDAEIAKGLTLDEARRIASNIAKPPVFLGTDASTM